MTSPTVETTQKTRTLVVDDHPIFRAGLRSLLETVPSCDVVGEECTAPGAVTAARLLRPDLVLMDVDLPDGSGVEATKAIVCERPATVVLALTMLEDQATMLAMMRAGARGYLLKGAGFDEISKAVDAVRLGNTIFGREVADIVLDQLVHPRETALPFPELTDRERAVLEMVADGRDNVAIARELHLSVKTVRNYLSRIFAKLQVAHRAEAAVRARREGLGH
jgi:DNA-binding NarL/FixJ family response regulator